LRSWRRRFDIYEGARDIQRLTIARSMLGLFGKQAARRQL